MYGQVVRLRAYALRHVSKAAFKAARWLIIRPSLCHVKQADKFFSGKQEHKQDLTSDGLF